MGEDSHGQDVLIVGAARTPTGSFSSVLLSKSATDLGAIAAKSALERSGIDPGTIYEVIMGNVVPAGIGQAPARRVALGAGAPLRHHPRGTAGASTSDAPAAWGMAGRPLRRPLARLSPHRGGDGYTGDPYRHLLNDIERRFRSAAGTGITIDANLRSRL